MVRVLFICIISHLTWDHSLICMHRFFKFLSGYIVFLVMVWKPTIFYRFFKYLRDWIVLDMVIVLGMVRILKIDIFIFKTRVQAILNFSWLDTFLYVITLSWSFYIILSSLSWYWSISWFILRNSRIISRGIYFADWTAEILFHRYLISNLVLCWIT